MERRGQAWPGGGGPGGDPGDAIPGTSGWHRPGWGKKPLFEVVSRFFNKFFCVLGSGKNWGGVSCAECAPSPCWKKDRAHRDEHPLQNEHRQPHGAGVNPWGQAPQPHVAFGLSQPCEGAGVGGDDIIFSSPPLKRVFLSPLAFVASCGHRSMKCFAFVPVEHHSLFALWTALLKGP